MVLNDPVDAIDPYASSQEPYNQPISSPDLYSDSESGRNLLNYGRKQIHRPMPILGPLFGYSKQRILLEITKSLESIITKQERPLTSEEVDALLYHHGKGLAIASWGMPTGFLVGLYRANATRADFRHPFTGPMKRENGWFDGERIRIMGREILRGTPARAFLHGFRTINYLLVNTCLFGLFISSYALTVQTVGEIRDPRLQNIKGGMKDSMEEAQKASAAKARARQAAWDAARPKSKRTSSESNTVNEWRKNSGRASQEASTTTYSDDASPAAADGYEGFISEDMTLNQNDDTYNNNNNNNEFNYSPPQSSTSPPIHRKFPRPYSPPTSEDPAPTRDDFPTDEPTTSAWERIRRKAESGDRAWPSGKEK